MKTKSSRGHDFSPLIEILQAIKGEKIVFVPNPGNAGDNLINLGMYKLFRQVGISYETGNKDSIYPDRIVVYSGGGAILDIYPGADTFFRRNHATCRKLILLPHTVRGYDDLIAAMGGNCILFAREANTLSFMHKNATDADIRFCHDLAFYLEAEDLTFSKFDGAFWLRRDLRLSWPKMLMKFLLNVRPKTSTLSVFRDDVEATDIEIPPHNADLSRYFSVRDMRYIACQNVAYALSLVIRMFPAVETNRLHIAIASAILSRDVTMHDNSYGKNRDIFDASIAEYFSNVSFQAQAERP